MWEELFGKDYEDKSFALSAANGILIMLTDKGILYTAEASPEGFKEIAHCDVLEGANGRGSSGLRRFSATQRSTAATSPATWSAST